MAVASSQQASKCNETEARLFCNLIMKVLPPHLCLILFIRSNPLGLALKGKPSHQEVGDHWGLRGCLSPSPRLAKGLAHLPMTLFLIQERCDSLLLPGTPEQLCFLPSPNPVLQLVVCQLPRTISKLKSQFGFLHPSNSD